MIEQHRINLGLSITQASQLAGMKPGSWSNIERGLVRFPEHSTVCKMLAGMGIALIAKFDKAPKWELLQQLPDGES